MQKAKQVKIKAQRITVKNIVVKADDKKYNRKNKRTLSIYDKRRINIWF